MVLKLRDIPNSTDMNSVLVCQRILNKPHPLPALTVAAAVFYRPPDSSDRFFDEFEAFLNSVETTEGNKKLLILGDFNLPKIDWKNLTTCSPTELNFCETLKDFYLSQMVLSPTRITDESQSIMNLVITNNPDNILNLHVVNPLDMQFSSDHLLVLFDFIWKPKRPPKQIRFVYSYKKADFDALRDTLDATPFLCALDENVDVD